MGVEPTGDTECPPSILKTAKPTGTYPPPQSKHILSTQITQDYCVLKDDEMNNNSLQDKVAIVTGSRRGIGRAIALAFTRAGADVAVCDAVLDDGKLKAVAEEIRNMGQQSLAVQVDISHKNQVGDMVQKTVARFGKIDILVNCAGVWIPGQTIVECTEENWDKVIDTNLKGTYFCCQAAGKVMMKQNTGNIINLSSQVGLNPGTGIGAYSISKAGIIMLTRQLALELAAYNIRVNAIAPGVVKTDFNLNVWKDPQNASQLANTIPLGKLADPEDVAQPALFLASDASGYITGSVINVDGGWKVPAAARRQAGPSQTN
jgi:NAD(P)-dependent dehydrogenase (short-subunit alcohol dehydrogenase family)